MSPRYQHPECLSGLQATVLVSDLVGRYVGDLLGVDDWRGNKQVTGVLAAITEIASGVDPADVGAVSSLFPGEFDKSRKEPAEPHTERELLYLQSLNPPHMRRALETIRQLRVELVHAQAELDASRA